MPATSELVELGVVVLGVVEPAVASGSVLLVDLLQLTSIKEAITRTANGPGKLRRTFMALPSVGKGIGMMSKQAASLGTREPRRNAEGYTGGRRDGLLFVGHRRP